MIPVLSIVFIGVSAAVSIGLPIALFFAFRKKYGLKIVPMLVGAAAFIVFAMVLEQLLHYFVLRPGPDGSIALRYKLMRCKREKIYQVANGTISTFRRVLRIYSFLIFME